MGAEAIEHVRVAVAFKIAAFLAREALRLAPCDFSCRERRAEGIECHDRIRLQAMQVRLGFGRHKAKKDLILPRLSCFQSQRKGTNWIMPLCQILDRSIEFISV